MRNQRQNGRKKERRNENDEDDGSAIEGDGEYIKVVNIHFNPSDLFVLKPNSFSCNLVLNYNLVRKLIPN